MTTMTEQTLLFEEYYTHKKIKCYKCGHNQYVTKKQCRKACRECHYNIDITRCIVIEKTSNRETVKKNEKMYDEIEKNYRVVKCPHCKKYQNSQAQWRVMKCLQEGCRKQIDLIKPKIVYETKKIKDALAIVNLENE